MPIKSLLHFPPSAPGILSAFADSKGKTDRVANFDVGFVSSGTVVGATFYVALMFQTSRVRSNAKSPSEIGSSG